MGACSGRDGERALLALSRHDPASALRLFKSALDGCPVTDEKELARLLYYLGIALLRLGQKDAAMDSWRAAHRLKQRTYALKMLRRYANCYGMERQTNGELDDWKAFLAIQVERYLSSKRNGRFSSEPERDMVRDLVFDYWRAIRASDVLDGRAPDERERLFRDVEIVFPYRLPEEGGSEVIPVDFRRKRRVALADRCPCGSGLTFMSCCGRLSAAALGSFDPISGT
jgi:tetratricopeptide (TPR) repeat protein